MRSAGSIPRTSSTRIRGPGIRTPRATHRWPKRRSAASGAGRLQTTTSSTKCVCVSEKATHTQNFGKKGEFFPQQHQQSSGTREQQQQPSSAISRIFAVMSVGYHGNRKGDARSPGRDARRSERERNNNNKRGPETHSLRIRGWHAHTQTHSTTRAREQTSIGQQKPAPILELLIRHARCDTAETCEEGPVSGHSNAARTCELLYSRNRKGERDRDGERMPPGGATDACAAF